MGAPWVGAGLLTCDGKEERYGAGRVAGQEERLRAGGEQKKWSKPKSGQESKWLSTLKGKKELQSMQGKVRKGPNFQPSFS